MNRFISSQYLYRNDALTNLANSNEPAIIITAIVARGLRFYLLAGLLFIFGEKIKVFIDKYFNILAILFFILLIGSVLLIKLI